MKTYQECVREYNDNIPHKSDLYLGGFLDAIAFIFNVKRARVIRDVEAYRTALIYEEEDA